ncbi:DUF5606 domain-containing protein [Pedobacter sp. P351]|uniref:DUF5606 family protein n=1 Tax=Pedobacter superstes TaxID=3133441 RepID=UPI0030959818
MNLKGLVAVSGKPGLYKIIGQNKSGFVLESLDEQKLKLIVNLTTAKLASLEDITIFGEDEDLKLIDIFENMKGSSSIPDPKSDGVTLRKYFREVASQHDEDRVYASDMKKIITWFNLIKDLPLFTETAGTPSEEPVSVEKNVAAVEEEVSAKVEEVKPAKKATAKKPKKAAE